MAKVKRGASADEESNAVEVFAGDVDADALLAAALGGDGEEEGAGKSAKKKKKGKKGALLEEDSNAVDVFGGAGVAGEGDLLAEALAGAGGEVGKKKKKKKKPRGGAVVEDDSNAVDVFAGGAKEGEVDLLAEALGETGVEENVEVSGGKKGGKKGKKKGSGVVEDESNAVDVFAGAAVEDGLEEDLLAAALEDADPAVKGKGKKEKKKGKGKNGKQQAVAKVEVAEEVVVAEEPAKVEEEKEEEVEDDFEPDAEVASEFELFSANVEDFTLAGRRKTARETRDERNAASEAAIAAAEAETLAEAEDRKPQERAMGDAKRANYGKGGEKFTSVRLEDVTVVFRNTPVLNGVTWGVKTGDRVGLVGQNGCGKTTQLKLIAGQLEPTSGEIVRSSARTKAAFLRQEFVDELDPTRTLREEFLSAFKEEQAALAAYKSTEAEIEEAGGDLDRLDGLLNQLEEAREKCDSLDAWNLESRIDKVMPGLGFVEDDNDLLVASFSGGWKVRIGIGKVLLQDPDLLLLDEPSNHLDMQSVEWLEEFLQNCDLPQIIVSHDRSFLNVVCNKIVHIEGGDAYEYPGNYQTFLKLKDERWKAWQAAWDRQNKFLTEQRNYIKQNRTSAARAKQVKSRQKMLERMERTGQLVRQPPRGGKPLVFRFPPAPRSGRDVVLVDDVSHGYDDKLLFKNASIAIERGDRMAILGPNGSGKSTMLRLIAGKEKPRKGSVECEDLHNVKLAYFEQNQADALDLTVTVLETLKRAAPSDWTYEQIRALLGKFLFKGDSVEKKVEALSGGEKARLALAKMMLEPCNVMVLDEPTNHIDAAAMDMLEEALQHYDGTLIVVSHDRFFVSQVATQILSLEDQELVLHDGDYKSFMEKNKNIKAFAEARAVDGTDGIKNARKVIIDESADVLDKKKGRKKKSFGGSGVASGGADKGVKNAKRWSR